MQAGQRLLKIYDRLFDNARTELDNGQGLSVDSHILNPAGDRRRGLTLLIRPSATTAQAIQDVQAQLRTVLPDQYFYPLSDLHFTILSVISCTPDFNLEELPIEKYADLIQVELREQKSFPLILHGLTMTRSAIMAQGFFRPGSLGQIRDRLRTAFRASGLHHTIDQRYVLETAHCTLIRFTQPLNEPRYLTASLAKVRRTKIGSFQVDQVELVANDWYQRKENTRLLQTYPLIPNTMFSHPNTLPSP